MNAFLSDITVGELFVAVLLSGVPISIGAWFIWRKSRPTVTHVTVYDHLPCRCSGAPAPDETPLPKDWLA